MKAEYVTGSRADFGLMREALVCLDAAETIDLGIVITGQALVDRYGDVETEVTDAGLKITAKIPAPLGGNGPDEMARAFGLEAQGFVDHWSSSRPDVVIVLGDRGEMLAATIIAYHLQIPTVHLHGGELSGTLDEGFRHAISKLASYHFVATEDAANRLERMGERPDRIITVGAPGLVEVSRTKAVAKTDMADRFKLDATKPLAVLLFHPVVDATTDGKAQAAAVLASLAGRGFATVALQPNSDAGGKAIEEALEGFMGNDSVVVINHLERTDYLELVKSADLLIGNSSSGIIETASLGTPCVNLGSRQDGRLRNNNVVDCPIVSRPAIEEAIDQAMQLNAPFKNLFGDGHADERILTALLSVSLDADIAAKRNAY